MQEQIIEKKQLLELIKQPNKCKQMCACLIFSARKAIAENQVLSGLHELEKAYHLAELLLELDANQAHAEIRYANIITELGYLYRLLNRHKSLNSLIKMAQLKVRQHCYIHNENHLLMGISYTLRCHDKAIDYWLYKLQSLVNLNQGKKLSRKKHTVNGSKHVVEFKKSTTC